MLMPSSFKKNHAFRARTVSAAADRFDRVGIETITIPSILANISQMLPRCLLCSPVLALDKRLAHQAAK